jgi:serine/threonine-protein kinase
VFAAGIVLWECLTGHRLFAQSDKVQGVERVLTMPIPRPSTHDKTLSRDIDAIVMRALERDPSARYASAADFAQALHAAIPPACPFEVSRWVEDVAQGSISGHARLLRELETSKLPDPANGNAGRISNVRRIGGPVPTMRVVTTDLPTVPSGPPVFESGRWRKRIRSRRALWVALGAASLCVIGALSIGNPEPRPPERTETETVRPGSAALPANTRSESTEATKPMQFEEAPAELPVLALPLEARATSSSQSFGVRVPVEPPAPRAQASGSGATRTQRRVARRPSAPAVPKPDASATPAATPSSTLDVTQATSPPAPSCDPPYRIDAFGVRRVRRECL